MSSNFYRSEDSPKYILGHALEIGFSCAGLIGVLILRFTYTRINKEREARGTGDLTAEQMTKMGDRSPAFRYTL